MNFRTIILIWVLGLPTVQVWGQTMQAEVPLAPTSVTPSESVRKVTGVVDGLSVGERVKVVNSLGTNLSAVDSDALIRYLAAPLAPSENSSSIHWLKNEVIGQLRAQNPPLAQLPPALAALYQDAKQEPVIRDYALQHLAECRWDQNALKQAQFTLVQATCETTGSFAGTALLGLVRIQKSEGGSVEESRNTALAMACNPKLSEISRLTALSVCGQLGEAKALPVALAAIREDQSTMIKITALGVLGKLGGKTELPFLARLEAAGESRLLPALRQARKDIEARLGQINGRPRN